MPPILRSFVSPEELDLTDLVTYDELASRAKTFNRSEALHFLGFVNLLLSVATIETARTGKIEPVRDVQTRLASNLLSAGLLSDLRAQLGTSSLLDRPLLHRSQVLFAIRLVATHGRADTQGNCLQIRDDFDGLGDLLFRVNGLFRPLTPPRGALPLWVAADSAPLNELESPPRLELTWPRVHRLLTEYLPAAVPDSTRLAEIESVALFGSGFNTEQWLDLNFLLSSYWTAVPFGTLMENRDRAYLRTDKDHEAISQGMLGRSLQTLGVPFDAVPDALKLASFEQSALYDLTPFRKTPLWLMPNNLALCIDASMVVERLGAFAYWSVMNSLDTPERRKTFSSCGFRKF